MKASVFFFKFPLESSLGGAELHTLKLAQDFQKQGRSVQLITSDCRLFRLFEKNRLPRRRIFAGWEPTSKWTLLLWPVTYLMALRRFKKLLRQIPEGSTLFMQSLTEKLTLTAPAISKHNVIWLEHKIPRRWLKLNPLKSRYLKLARKAEVVTVSNFAKQEFLKLGVPEKNIRVVYPEIQIPNSTFHIQHSKFYTIGILSRLDPEKGVLDFVNTILSQLKNRPNWRVVVAGEGPQEKNLQSLVGNYNLAKQIKLLGFVNDLDEFFSQVSVLVYPTKVPEAFGISVLEAMTRGIPVIASNLGALSEIIDHQKTGFLVNKDKPADWLQVLRLYEKKTKSGT